MTTYNLWRITATEPVPDDYDDPEILVWWPGARRTIVKTEKVRESPHLYRCWHPMPGVPEVIDIS